MSDNMCLTCEWMEAGPTHPRCWIDYHRVHTTDGACESYSDKPSARDDGEFDWTGIELD